MNENLLRRMRIAALVLFAIGIAAVLTGGQEACAAKPDPALRKITTYKFGDSREALSVVEDLVRDTQGNLRERLSLEKQFASILKSDATYECKDFICRQLGVIGTKESVPALKKLLPDEKTSDMARYALMQNPAPEAGKALRDVLKKAEGKVRIGIINTLGDRRDSKCIDALKRCIDDVAKMHEKKDKEKDDSEEAKKARHEIRDTGLAAINALAKIGGEEAAKILAEARHISCPKINKAATDALLFWADNMVESSKKTK